MGYENKIIYAIAYSSRVLFLGIPKASH